MAAKTATPEVAGDAILVTMIQFLRGLGRESVRFWHSLRRLLRGGSLRLSAEELTAAAGRLGLTDTRLTDGGLEGRAGDFLVVAEAMVRTTVEGEVGEYLSVLVRTERPFGFIPQGPPSAVSAVPVETGDPELDAILKLRGDPLMASALLDHATRRDLRLLTDVGLRAQAGALVLVITYPVDAEELVEIIGALVELARRLLQPEDVVPLLARNAVEDPVPGVRMRCLQHLARRFADRPESRDALRRGLEDAEPEVQRVATTALGKEPGAGAANPGAP